MRVTSTHIIELASQATSRAQSKVADATGVASSGLRVQVPSDDPVAWADAQREKTRQTLSTGTGGALAASRTDVQETDSSLASLTGIVAQARQLAVQGSSTTAGPGDRSAIAAQVTALYKSALAAANAQGADGHYLLAGSQTGTEPFDAAGAYHGDGSARDITTGENVAQTVGVPGSVLTADGSADTVDILPELAKLATALGANDLVGVQGSLGTLSTATTQLGVARGKTGAALAALTDADTQRGLLETRLAGVISNLVQADGVGAASTLAQATQILNVTQAVTQHVISTLQQSA